MNGRKEDFEDLEDLTGKIHPILSSFLELQQLSESLAAWVITSLEDIQIWSLRCTVKPDI